MHKKPSISEKINYKIDSIMSKGTIALVIALAIITFSIAAIAGLSTLIIEIGQSNNSIAQSIWKSFVLTLDAGNLAGVEGSAGLITIASLVTLCGIFITSTLIGIIHTGLESRLDNLRKGTSKVIESGHTVIIGFNETVYAILTELIIANENHGKSCIIVLGTEEKTIMEEKIADRISDSKNTTIICRNSNLSLRYDLSKCSIETCKSIIINENDDSQVIKTILAVSNILENENCSECNAFISAIVNEEGKVDVAKIAGQGRAEIVYFKNAISRIMAHTCCQAGLSSVYREILNFEGDEIYIERFPQLTGQKFIGILNLFDKSTVIGIKKEQNAFLNPSMETVVEEGDEIILIASDDGVSVPSKVDYIIDQSTCVETNLFNSKVKTERLLILGNNEYLECILSELDIFISTGSKIKIASDDKNITEEVSNIRKAIKNIEITVEQCDICDRSILQRLLNEGADHVLVLSDLNCNSESSDAKTLLILLQLRDISQKLNMNFSIISEMVDVRNQELAKITNVDDFVISGSITSLMITQISENRYLAPIFEDLYDSEGSEFHLKPVINYVKVGEPTNFYNITHCVSKSGEIPVGYKRVCKDTNGRSISEIYINPEKNKEILFTEEDYLIVLAEK